MMEFNKNISLFAADKLFHQYLPVLYFTFIGYKAIKINAR